MAYDEYLADRIRNIFEKKNVRFEEKKMMGGLCFMVNNKMCVGVVDERLMARLGAEAVPKALKLKGCVPMDFTGRPLKAFVFVNPEGIDNAKSLSRWIERALDFNPEAKSYSKKKKSK